MITLACRRVPGPAPSLTPCALRSRPVSLPVGGRAAPPAQGRRHRCSHDDELHPVSDIVHEQRLAVKVEQRVQPGIAFRRRHRRTLSTSDNKRKTSAASSGRRADPGTCRNLLADIRLPPAPHQAVPGEWGASTRRVGWTNDRYATTASRPDRIPPTERPGSHRSNVTGRAGNRIAGGRTPGTSLAGGEAIA